MKIEAIIVCVGYADYLEQTLPHNLPHFDRVTVITSYEDVETQELCKRFSCAYYATDLFYAHGDKFAKSRGIDYGIAYNRFGEWIAQIDADTYLPPMTRRFLDRRDEMGSLNPEYIYGCDRVNCVGFETWKKFLASDPMGHDFFCRIKVPDGMPLGDRIHLPEYGGYMPLGFFQLWHAKHERRYPTSIGSAERDDVLHAMQWPVKNRFLLPEIIAVHLMEGNTALGSNWKGRVTPRFAAPAKPIHPTPIPIPTPKPVHPQPVHPGKPFQPIPTPVKPDPCGGSPSGGAHGNY